MRQVNIRLAVEGHRLGLKGGHTPQRTMYYLHGIDLAHLDITSSNIMLRKEGYSAWDQLRLLDFGFAHHCNKDVTVLDVNPQGATPAYAAPELLRSLQLHCEEFDVTEPGLLINGPSADWWAVGIVLFELLTGELPFPGKAAAKAPEYINSLCKEQWEDYEGVLQAHQSWVQACEVAFQTGSEVQHPLLDRVRQCSTAPDQAASFFLQLFHPVPHERVKAIDHTCHRQGYFPPWWEQGVEEQGHKDAEAPSQKMSSRQAQSMGCVDPDAQRYYST
ncbi:hypothetical protein WJX82_000449 [Trebouxia sp. C0006]